VPYGLLSSSFHIMRGSQLLLELSEANKACCELAS